MTNVTNTRTLDRIMRENKDLISKLIDGVKYAEAHWLVPAMHLAGIIPMVFIVANTGGALLGISSIGDIEDMAEGIGSIAMYFFGAMLACTPLYAATGWRRPLGFRKPLGLYAFMYTAVHMAGFFAAYDFNTHSFIAETLTSATMISGGLALALMVPLALTSNRWSMKRLGRKWKQLHKLTYLIAVLAVAHLFITGDGGAIAVAYIALLIARIPPVRKAIIKARNTVKQRGAVLLPNTP